MNGLMRITTNYRGYIPAIKAYGPITTGAYCYITIEQAKEMLDQNAQCVMVDEEMNKLEITAENVDLAATMVDGVIDFAQFGFSVPVVPEDEEGDVEEPTDPDPEPPTDPDGGDTEPPVDPDGEVTP